MTGKKSIYQRREALTWSVKVYELKVRLGVTTPEQPSPCKLSGKQYFLWFLWFYDNNLDSFLPTINFKGLFQDLRVTFNTLTLHQWWQHFSTWRFLSTSLRMSLEAPRRRIVQAFGSWQFSMKVKYSSPILRTCWLKYNRLLNVAVIKSLNFQS